MELLLSLEAGFGVEKFGIFFDIVPHTRLKAELAKQSGLKGNAIKLRKNYFFHADFADFRRKMRKKSAESAESACYFLFFFLT
ncbi:hypothetical protein [Flavobacterium sp. M31R6]|uniref:hypothetical protein n=1 Tax=Flavobacterium sp. M31R6 TaxID=2739062 RepID=UPI0015696A35|nr:hypothetical protein [Flavobacterium sp. M31R6]QKJ62674.1 hypothetical protein HQN62_05840 [Flavobacterium sp. M31R6]